MPLLVWPFPARSRRLLKSIAALGAIGLILTFAVNVWLVVQLPARPTPDPRSVSDVGQLTSTAVSAVVTPTTVEDIVREVRDHRGPISIGGARHSTGGQIVAAGGLHLDMRRFNRILDFSPEKRTITVQAGTTWRQIQERIDPSGLSVSIMQSYANFTVGGSLSVNGHGRYVGRGPLIRSVEAITVVLADGSVVAATPAERADIFYGVIGGYGGLGVIVDATLTLTDNVRLKRHTTIMPISTYGAYFSRNVRGRASAVLHSANIFPGAYDEVRAVTHEQTNDPVTIDDRLMPWGRGYALNRLAFWMQTEWPLGTQLRRHAIDPLFFRGQPVTWRNYEASRDADELEPSSRAAATYLLQEYFVPVERFDAFVPRLRDVLRRHRVNVVNISVRHAIADPGSLLAWARTEVFAFVIYYKQNTDTVALTSAGVWTRELIDVALDSGGSYYLPYQLDATDEQFRKAYPRAFEYLALKRRLDPEARFRNALIDKYLH
jgi:FAD/FMN-containing dehydrogenase